LLKTVPRTSVHGIFIGRNRWLGALILFANTIIGRLVLLLARGFTVISCPDLRLF
jgi:hypothetical protein